MQMATRVPLVPSRDDSVPTQTRNLRSRAHIHETGEFHILTRLAEKTSEDIHI